MHHWLREMDDPRFSSRSWTFYPRYNFSIVDKRFSEGAEKKVVDALDETFQCYELFTLLRGHL